MIYEYYTFLYRNNVQSISMYINAMYVSMYKRTYSLEEPSYYLSPKIVVEVQKKIPFK